MSLSTWQSYIDFMIERGNIEQLMIISSEDGSLWGSSDPDGFYLREYSATITQEDGSEKEETVNEAANIVKLMKGQAVSQGLRMNGTKKQQITRKGTNDETGLPLVISKFPMGGACVANAGKCIIIGTFNEVNGHTSPACNETVTMMAGYLKKSNWPDRLEAVGGVNSGGDTGAFPSGDGSTAAGAGGSPNGSVTWQKYVDVLMVGKGNVDQALIIEISNSKVLASTANCSLQVYEAEIPQEDGTDKTETVNEVKNIIQVR